MPATRPKSSSSSSSDSPSKTPPKKAVTLWSWDGGTCFYKKVSQKLCTHCSSISSKVYFEHLFAQISMGSMSKKGIVGCI